ncbi:hypothetical protein EBR57_09575 [bacterium]|nr:hypothetical protein [bacterium]
MPPLKTILTAPMFTSLAQFFTEFESEKRIHRTSKLTKSVVDIVAGSISVGLSSEQEALLRLLDAWQQAGNDDQLKHQLVTFFESRFPAFRNPMGRDWTQSPVVQLLNRPDLAQDLKLRLGSYRVGLREL